jgi:hypothetical protein
MWKEEKNKGPSPGTQKLTLSLHPSPENPRKRRGSTTTRSGSKGTKREVAWGKTVLSGSWKETGPDRHL